MKKLNPFGVELFELVSGETLREMVLAHGVVLIRQKHMPNRTEFLAYAKTLGKCLEWDFGEVNELKVDESKKNYLYSHEKVPFHWDGAFKVSPSFLLFHCLDAPAADAGGETLFTHTGKIYRSFNASEKKTFESVSLTYKTDKVVHYGGSVTTALIDKHPHTKAPILRYAEPVLTKHNPVSIKVTGLEQESQADFTQRMSGLIYDKQFCYIHTWQQNDLLIADNHALIHGRHAFKINTKRHIRRIQII